MDDSLRVTPIRRDCLIAAAGRTGCGVGCTRRAPSTEVAVARALRAAGASLR
jgi:hypothetical protein